MAITVYFFWEAADLFCIRCQRCQVKIEPSRVESREGIWGWNSNRGNGFFWHDLRYFDAILLLFATVCYETFYDCGQFVGGCFFLLMQFCPSTHACVVLWWVASTSVAKAWLKGWCGSRRGRLLWWNDDFESKIINIHQHWSVNVIFFKERTMLFMRFVLKTSIKVGV